MGLFGFGKKKFSQPARASDDDIYEDEDEGESLSVYDAALIWVSNGKDEDYMFGFTAEELEDALQ